MLFWSPAFATGHPAIDRQHQTLFQRVHDLAVAIGLRQGEAEMRRVLSAVSVYVEVHFRMEEGLMRRAGYPGLAVHRAEHQHLRAQVEALVDQYEGRPPAGRGPVGLPGGLAGRPCAPGRPGVGGLPPAPARRRSHRLNLRRGGAGPA